MTIIKKMLLYSLAILSFNNAFGAETTQYKKDYSSQKYGSSLLGGAASQKTRDLANELLEKLDPKMKLTSIIHMNRFIRYWMGQQNACAIPFLNYLLVNEEWLAKLPAEAQRFVIGRTLITLARANEFIILTVLLPALGLALSPSVFIPLITSYIARSLEYDADKMAAIEFDCVRGGQIALEDTESFKNDGTFFGVISSNVNIVSGLLPIMMPIKSILPGKFTNRTSRLGKFGRNLPIASWFSRAPKTGDRIKALYKLEMEKNIIA